MTDSPLTVEIFKSDVNPEPFHPWYVRLKARNGQTLMTSEGYVTRWNAKRAAAKMFPDLPVKFVQGRP